VNEKADEEEEEATIFPPTSWSSFCIWSKEVSGFTAYDLDALSSGSLISLSRSLTLAR
jgi:hypothetical protein